MKYRNLTHLSLLLSALALPLQAGAVDTLLISEFMASNNGTLADEDGEFPDWIEIHNAGSVVVSLLNWSLTDAAGTPGKWLFPATNLSPGGFLVVFASGNDRRQPGAPLHTSFRLDADGEYVGLARPDGTVVSAFAPEFPPQTVDIAYGLGASGSNVVLVATGALARAWVPRDGSLGLTWTEPDFDDSGWITGTTGVGFERTSGYEALLGLDLLSPALPAHQRIDTDGDGVNENNSVYIRIPFVPADPAAVNTLRLRMRHDDGFVAYLNGTPVASDNEPVPVAWDSRAASDYGDAADLMLAIVYGPGNSITIYREGEVYANAAGATTGSLQTYPANIADVLIGKRHEDLSDGGTATGADGFLAGSVNEARIYSAPLSAAEIRHLYGRGPLGGTEPPPASVATNLVHLWSFNDGTARDVVGAANGALLNGALVEQGRLVLDGVNDYMRSQPIGTTLTVRTLMVWVSLANLSQQAGSALTLENPTGSDVFDGIIFGERVPRQWMNGSSNFGRSVVDNGGPLETLIETTPSDFVAFDLSPFTDRLRAGTNILAIHGLNLAPDDSDLLILPELIGGGYVLEMDNAGYFDTPTPGAMNTAVFQRLFASLEFSDARGFHSTPFALSISSSVPGVTIRYTVDGTVPGETNGTGYTGPIAISGTTIVRAAAFRPGYAPTDAVTQTYVFLGDILRQVNTAPAGAHWDTEMDPQVVNNSNQTWTAGQGLVDLPALSIVMDPADLFGSDGIYPNATARGDEWERAASVEYFYPDEYAGRREGAGFAINCGIQINGNFSRLAHQPKHSFRLLFKEKWGPPKLQFPVFADYEVTEFDTLLVACGHNQGWSTGIPNSQFLRNRFCWDLENVEPGRAYVHSQSVHVYLNGQYWGMYDFHERPDDSFSAANFGGEKEAYDVFKGLRTGGSTQARIINGVRDAWAELFAIAGRDLTQPTNYAAIEQLVDMDQFIDYTIGILYTADRDGPTGWLNGPPNSLEPKNFYATRRRAPDGRFRFWRWDSEFVLENEHEDVSERNGYENPGLLHYRLRVNPEYRVRFADRVQRLCFADGVFATAALTNLYLALAGEIDRAIVAESARWGDAKREPPYTRDVEWVTERNRIVNTYLPRRLDIFLDQLRADGLFPTVAAPVLNLDGVARHGGVLVPGNQLTFSAPQGQVYYTLDGTDPRLPGGGVAPGAVSYTRPIDLTDTVVVTARALDQGKWSALTDATFFIPPDWSTLTLSEIMYNPPADGESPGDDFEFLELKNTGSATLALEGLRFTDGVRYRFGRGVLLSPGGLVVLARNAAQFAAKYPGLTADGVYRGELDNGGERLRLEDPTTGPVLEVSYGDSAPWPVTPDNHGFSLVRRDPDATADPEDPLSWRASAAPGGSPGADDPPSLIPAIRINEVLSASVSPQLDTIELLNPTPNEVDLSGWFLSDENNRARKFRIPDGTRIAAGGFVVFDELQFNSSATTNDFALSSGGEQVYLFSADLAGRLTGYDHGFAFGAAAPGVSFGRHVLSTGAEDFPAQIAFTPKAVNAGPRIGPVVITEIMYHPAAGGDAFVELLNQGAAPAPLYDPPNPGNTWRLNGVDYAFPPGLELAPGGRLLVVGADPEGFRARYGVPSTVAVLGPYGGRLQNDGERLQLQRPGAPDGGEVPFITVDMVRYDDRAPWPVAADGIGPSLQRLAPGWYGNDPAHWTAALPTPGTDYPGGTPPEITTEPVDYTTVAYLDAAFAVAATGAAPLHYQWRFGGAPISGATGAVLVLTNVQPEDAGEYSVAVFNAAGSVVSSKAQLVVRIPAVITAHPTDRTVANGGIASFDVSATGQGVLRYQWRYNGAELAGETNIMLILSNVQPAQAGAYSVVVTDEVGSTPSRPAWLTVLVRPSIVWHPQPQTALEGGTASFSVTVADTGTLPMTYRWRRNGVTRFTETTHAHTSSFTLTDVRMTDAGNYTAAISNPAGIAPVSAGAALTVLADADHDGMADAWELIHGFSSADPADAALDADGDGMSNRDEFVAGTDPGDAGSHLRVDGIELGSAVRLWFSAVSNRAYAVEYSDTLPAGAWNLLTNVPAFNTNHAPAVIDPEPGPGRFYRLLIP